jgi:hypothetical protein
MPRISAARLTIAPTLLQFICMETVIIKMSWKSGCGKVIACSTGMTVEEVARENGFTLVNGREPLFIFKGRILQPQLTLHYHNIRDGASIIAYIGFSCAFLPLKLRRARFVSRTAQEMDEARDNEAARLLDRDFMLWEMVKGYPELLAICWRDEENNEEKAAAEVTTEKTVITSEHTISEAPLPLMLKPDDGFWWRERLRSLSDRY